MTTDSIFKELIYKVIVIDNNTILEEIKSAKLEGYKYLMVQQSICQDFGITNEETTSIINTLKFYKAKDLLELHGILGTIYVLDEIMIN